MSKTGSEATSRDEVQRALQQPEKGTNQGEGGKHTSPENDAKGQYARTRHGASNDGVTSAEPRVFSGEDSGDATWPLQQDKGKDS